VPRLGIDAVLNNLYFIPLDRSGKERARIGQAYDYFLPFDFTGQINETALVKYLTIFVKHLNLLRSHPLNQALVPRLGIDAVLDNRNFYALDCTGQICDRIGQIYDYTGREFIDYKTSMITDEDPLRGLLFH
jgi:hypothetical protein